MDFREAELALADYVLRHAKPKDAKPEDTPLEAVLLRYWNEHAKTLPSAEAEWFGLRYWSELMPGITVAELTPERQERFIAALRDRGLSESYISRILSPGRAALTRAYKRGELRSAPFIMDVKRPPAPERHILKPDEAHALLSVSDGHLTTFLWLAFGTLARPGAILELTWFGIDLDRRRIDFNQPGRMQTNKRRPVTPICANLAQYLAAIEKDAGYVVSYAGRRLDSIKMSFRKARAKAGLPAEVSPYCIRHTMAVWLREQSVPEWECAGIMGHRLPGYRTTEIYAKYRPDYLSAAADAIDAFMTEARMVTATRTALRASCVLVPKLKVVGAGGIEPPTPTMST
jgi:integrase